MYDTITFSVHRNPKSDPFLICRKFGKRRIYELAKKS